MSENMLINKGDKYFGDLLWVISAKSNKLFPENLNGVLIEGEGEEKKVIATDRCILFLALANNEKLKPGFYKVIRATKKGIVLFESDCVFPNWKNVFPKEKDEAILFNLENRSSIMFSKLMTFIVRKLPKGYSVNYECISKLCIGKWRIELNGSGPIRLENKNKKALIMPMKM